MHRPTWLPNMKGHRKKTAQFFVIGEWFSLWLRSANVTVRTTQEGQDSQKREKEQRAVLPLIRMHIGKEGGRNKNPLEEVYSFLSRMICTRAMPFSIFNGGCDAWRGLGGFVLHWRDGVAFLFIYLYCFCRACSLAEQNFLRALMSEFERTGLQEAKFLDVYHSFKTLCVFDGKCFWVHVFFLFKCQ